ncbi:YncE family protein [Nocardia sp. NBC_00416]|uniref:YncE family protein n=1 Tax=Nocardia sp. NBC_00416 TaxID=2975991 RepID=UPI002E242173
MQHRSFPDTVRRIRRRRPRATAAIALFAAAVLLTGCSNDSEPGPGDAPTREPATPAASPPVTTAPAGQVFPTPTPLTALVSDPGSGNLAGLDDSRTVLTLLTPATEPPTSHQVRLPAPAAAIAAGSPGQILAATDGAILRVDAATRAVTRIPVDGDLRSVRSRPDGTLFAGTADGRVHILDRDGRLQHTVSGLVSADALALTGDTLAVLDRHQTLLTEIEPGYDRLGLALRAGTGAANLVEAPYDRVIVTDPDSGQLMVFTTEPLVLRQRYPVGSSPYALAYDRRSDTVWATCTQSNEIVGYDLSTGIPREVGRYPTVRQPNAVTVDDATGDLYIGSATEQGLQRIPADQRKRGQ